MKKITSWILSLAMLISLLACVGISASAATYSDMPEKGYWSYEALDEATNNGILNGYKDGTIRPTAKITRAEAAAIINRTFGATKEDPISFSDVTASSWYYSDVQKAVHMKTFNGVNANHFGGDSFITRAQAFTVIARALGLNNGTAQDLTQFVDASIVPAGFISNIGAMVKAGYVAGNNGYLNPNNYISREEFAKVVTNVISQFIAKPETYTSVTPGNVLVQAGGVTLKNLTVTGDLIVGDGVGTGDVTLDNVSVTGRIVLRGAGVNSFKVIGKSSAASVVVAKATDGGIHIDVSDEANVQVVYVDDGSDDVIVEGTVGSVNVAAEGAIVTLRNADITTVNMASANSSVTLESGTVDGVVVAPDAIKASIEVAATGSASANIGTISTSAGNTQINVGKGSVSAIVALGASSGTVITTGTGAKVGTVAVASTADVSITNQSTGAIGNVVAEKGATVTALTSSGAVDTSVKILAGTITVNDSTGNITIKSNDGAVNTTVSTGAPSAGASSGGTGGGSSGGVTEIRYNSISNIAYSTSGVAVTVSNGSATKSFQAIAAVANNSNYFVLLNNGYILCQYNADGPFSADDTIFLNYNGHSGSTTRSSYISGTSVEGKYATAYSQRDDILSHTSSVEVNYTGTGTVAYNVNPTSDSTFVSSDGFVFLAPTDTNAEAMVRNMIAAAFVFNSSASPSGTVKQLYSNNKDICGTINQAMVTAIAEDLIKPFAKSVRDGNNDHPISIEVYKESATEQTMLQYGDNQLTLSNDLTISVNNSASNKKITIAVNNS